MEGDQGMPGNGGPTGKQVLLNCIVYSVSYSSNKCSTDSVMIVVLPIISSHMID